MTPNELYNKSLSLYSNRGDPALAFNLMKQAAELGSVPALSTLGFFYMKGIGVGVDLVAAVRLFREASDQKDGVGLYNLAACYALGEGVAKNETTAFELYSQSASIGNVDALDIMGDYYYSGRRPCVQDYEAAVRFFKEACALRNAEATYKLGFCYEHGQGVRSKKNLATALYIISASLGSSVAKARATTMLEMGVYYSGIDKSAVSFYKNALVAGDQTLHRAAADNDIEAFKDLVFERRDIDFPINPDGDTVLTYSIMHGNTRMALTAVDIGADVNVALHNGRTSLMTAAGVGNIELISRLIGAGANIDWRRDNGGTALMYAAAKGQEQAARFLMDNGADRSMKDNDGWTVVDYARRFAPSLIRYF